MDFGIVTIVFWDNWVWGTFGVSNVGNNLMSKLLYIIVYMLFGKLS